ncbi:MAG: hypothetical protein OIF40_15825 [Mangrovicoccus sp.]|nr:hypothetical protein [Mangrovicoccus sp.]
MNNVVSILGGNRLGIHLIRITNENDRYVQCEKFDLETLEMVTDWKMLLRVEASLEVDELTPYEFSLAVPQHKS